MEVPILECQTNKGVDWRRVSKEPLKIQVAWPFECETNPPGFQAKQVLECHIAITPLELLHIKVTFFGEKSAEKKNSCWNVIIRV